jgi:ABC-type multidrug transport system ATPase subunit
VLTGRINASRGQVTLNGATPLSTIQKIVGFVGQEDIMYPMLTVRQVLVDSALSRLPEVWPLNKKLALVDDVMVCASDLHSFVLLCLT